MKSINANVSNPTQVGSSRRNSLVFSLIGGILLMLIIAGGCSTQPVWNGRTLSAWLSDLNNIDQNRSGPARIALKNIGTNAIPLLTQRLASKPPAFGEALAEKQSEAVEAFRILGNSATWALPTLGILLTNRADLDPMPIAQSMAGIGEGATPQLVSALNHPSASVRRASLVGLIDLGKKARDAMPSVMERLRDSDAEVRGLAVFFVSDVAEEREVKLRVLKEASQDSDRSVRSFAEKELSTLRQK